MAARFFPSRLKVPALASAPIAVTAPAAAGCLAALAVIVLPQGLLEDSVIDSGIAALIPAAAPPLGFTARIALALIAAVIAAGIVFFAITRIGTAKLGARPKRSERRRADSHPDAPPRAPLRASLDLGSDFPGAFAGDLETAQAIRISQEPERFEPAPSAITEPEEADEVQRDTPNPTDPVETAHREPIERDVPTDLDQPMAQFDPGAMQSEPREMPARLAPLRPTEPIVAPAPEPARRTGVAPDPIPAYYAVRGQGAASDMRADAKRDGEASVHSLLDRLERGMEERSQRRRSAPPAAHVDAEGRGRAANNGLNDTLADLRRLASGG